MTRTAPTSPMAPMAAQPGANCDLWSLYRRGGARTIEATGFIGEGRRDVACWQSRRRRLSRGLDRRRNCGRTATASRTSATSSNCWRPLPRDCGIVTVIAPPGIAGWLGSVRGHRVRRSASSIRPDRPPSALYRNHGIDANAIIDAAEASASVLRCGIEDGGVTITRRPGELGCVRCTIFCPDRRGGDCRDVESLFSAGGWGERCSSRALRDVDDRWIVVQHPQGQFGLCLFSPFTGTAGGHQPFIVQRMLAVSRRCSSKSDRQSPLGPSLPCVLIKNRHDHPQRRLVHCGFSAQVRTPARYSFLLVWKS